VHFERGLVRLMRAVRGSYRADLKVGPYPYVGACRNGRLRIDGCGSYDKRQDTACCGRDREGDQVDVDTQSGLAATSRRRRPKTTVKGLNIDVDTTAGVVVLNGTASSRAEADRAVMLARNTEGVSHVVDNLQVK